jgi:presenilin-like A22 family membrane protease
MSKNDLLSAVSVGCIFVVSYMAAILLAVLFLLAGVPREDPDNPVTPIIYIIVILVFSFVILVFVKKRRSQVIKYLILGAMAYVLFFIFFLIFSYVLFFTGFDPNYGLIFGIIIAGLITYLLAVHPEWYVVDSVGVLVAAGVTAVLGIIFGILPALILLIGLAIYDAISVYKTKHMVTLADAVTAEKLPVLLVIPKKKSYSYLKQKGIKEQIDKGEEREAMFMGLGDIIIPGVLVVASFITTESFLVPISTIIGILVGFSILMIFVLRGNPQAGLPLLNTGAIMGYVVSYLLIFQDFTLGISYPW